MNDRRRRVLACAAIAGLAAFACSGRARAPAADRGPEDGREGRAIAPTIVHSPDPVSPAIDDITARVHALRVLTGEATYYADRFDGRRTASGIVFRQHEPYAAHRTLPFGTVLRVTNERNGRSVIVRVVDRGPWGPAAKRRNTIIDLSRSAAERLGYVRAGRAPVRVEVLHLGPGV